MDLVFEQVGNSKYYNYHLSVNGTLEVHKNDPKTDYLTDVIVSSPCQSICLTLLIKLSSTYILLSYQNF